MIEGIHVNYIENVSFESGFQCILDNSIRCCRKSSRKLSYRNITKHSGAIAAGACSEVLMVVRRPQLTAAMHR